MDALTIASFSWLAGSVSSKLNKNLAVSASPKLAAVTSAPSKAIFEIFSFFPFFEASYIDLAGFRRRSRQERKNSRDVLSDGLNLIQSSKPGPNKSGSDYECL